MKKTFVTLLLGLCLVAALSGCGTTQKTELTVSAAASLKNAMTELTPLFEKTNAGTTLTFNYGASGDLQKQIENGSPVDVFISAAQKQMNALEDAGLLADNTRENFVENKLVLIVPKDNTTVTTIADLATDKVKMVALGEPTSVPAGQYAEEALTSLGLLDAVKAKAVYGKDVTQVLTYVENGEVEAGIVYKTDAISTDKVKIVAEFPADSYKAIVYPMAIIKDSKNEAASKKFMEFLKTEDASKILEKYGFTPVDQ